MYNSLKFFRDNDLSQYEEIIEQYFTTEVNSVLSDPSKDNSVALIPNGHSVRVTNANKEEFLAKKCHYIGYLSVKEQMDSLTEGFFKVIPRNQVSIFNTDELEAAICGNPRIELSDWKANTELKGFNSWSQTVSNFWAVMETFN